MYIGAVTILFLLPPASLTRKANQTRMPKELTASEQAMVAKASQDLHRYERICVEHSAVFREDLEAYQEYVAHPTVFAPQLGEPDRPIENAENVLKMDCKTVLEYAA